MSLVLKPFVKPLCAGLLAMLLLAPAAARAASQPAAAVPAVAASATAPAAASAPLPASLPVAASAPAVVAASTPVVGGAGAPTPAASGIPVATPAEDSEESLCRPLCDPGRTPLALDGAAVRLPTGRAGKAYKARIAASGGMPPYLFSLVGGKLPAGLAFGTDGVIEGTPTVRAWRRLTVSVTDAAGHRVQRGYVLAVLAAAKASAPEPEASAPGAPPKKLTELSAEQARTPLPPVTPIAVYEVTQDLIKSIADPALIIPPGDIETKLNSDARAQMKQLLAPMVGVEYPDERLFAAALDDRVCAYTAELLRTTAAAQNIVISAHQALETVCPASPVKTMPASPGASAPAASAPVPVLTAAVPVSRLTRTVLPPEWRSFVIARARHALAIKTFSVPGWKGTGCNCLMKSTTSTVYGFYPVWHDDARRPEVDWGVYDRVDLFAQLFDRDGNITPIPLADPAVQTFLHELHNHGSELDITLYQADWQFLARTTEAYRQRAIRQLAAQAVRQADTPMPGWQVQWQRWLPGDGFGEIERVAEGITVYLEPPADATLIPAFVHFRNALAMQLIEALRTSPYPHVLNIVLGDDDIVTTTGKRSRGARPGTEDDLQLQTSDLFAYLVLAEDPTIEEGHIRTGQNYHSKTGLTLRFLVLLPEPVATSARQLRRLIESDPWLVGGNQEILLRKLIPFVSSGSGTASQFSDNMAYFNDNFGGVALWQPPVDLTAATRPASGKAAVPATVQTAVTQAVRSTFLAGEPSASATCSWVCDWHWPLRALFFLLLIVMLGLFLLYLISSRIRAIGLRFQIGLIVGSLITITTGASLLQCDPGLKILRENNNFLYILLVILLLCAAVPLLRPKVEKP